MTVEELLEALEDHIPEHDVVFRDRDGYLIRVDGVQARPKQDRVELHVGADDVEDTDALADDEEE